MGILNIRNLPDDVHQALRARAAKNGTSMEAEARHILTAAVRPPVVAPEQLQNLVDQMFAGNRPRNVVDGLITERRNEARQELDS